MKRKLVAFLLTVLMVMGSTVAIFATAAHAEVPSNIVLSADEVDITDTGETSVSVGVWMTGVTDDDDVGSVQINVAYDSEKLRVTDCYCYTGSGKKKVSYGGDYFGGFQASNPAEGTNPWTILAWDVSTENQLWDTDWEINDQEFAFIDFDIIGTWTGTTPLTVTGKVLRRSDDAALAVSFANGFVKNGEDAVAETYTLNLATEGNGSINVAYGSVAETVVSAGFNPEIGDTVTLEAVGENFAFWKNALNGKILSTDAAYTYTATGAGVSLSAVFADVSNPSLVPVYCKDGLTGKLLGTLNLEAGTVLSADDITVEAPSMIGYTFEKWVIGADDAIGTAVTEPTTIVAHFVKDNTTTYTLTVNDGGVETVYERSFAAIATVVSTLDDFSYWKMGDTIVSTDKSYKFAMPNHDVTLTAVAGESAPEATIALLDCVLNNGTLVITESRALADGATLVESGVLLTRKATAADLVYPKLLSSVTQTASSDKTASVVGFQKTGMNAKTGTWLIRGYLVYRDSGNVIHTIYTDVASVVVA